MKNSLNTAILTDDPLKNIFIMAPLLDEAGQNRVFGLICGLISSGPTRDERKKTEAAV